MNNVSIRKFKPEDAEQLIKLVDFVWRNTYKNIFPEEVFKMREMNLHNRVKEHDKIYYNDNNKLTLVAERNSKIIGFVMGKMGSDNEHYNKIGFADLEAIYILPQYQKMGIGSQLKKLFVDWAKSNNANTIVISVLKENLFARQVYENWGAKLDSYSQPFIQLGVQYDEVFYILKI